MKDIIQLLPDQLANQIAAGEVIQRPASAVKELLENSLDAGATDIHLIISDAGKELIMVVDNGFGMSPIDARMSFERHATSKIRSIEDLFSIRTMGFRGEALPSIAAVAQVEIKTKTKEEELGTLLQIEAGEVKKQEPTACSTGTSFTIRNLFYNVPARRKFLKSNTAELKHIVDEFTHVALAFPEIRFRFTNNQTEQFNLKPTNLKGRILDLLGNRKEKSLIPINEETDFLKITGFIGKPDAATKIRGNQFFFINNRFIRSPYLNHAITTAYEGLIEKESFPFYVLYFEMDFERIDVNVHPSKQEVKFEDEKILYAYLHSSVKRALAQYNIAPSLDFTLDKDIQNLDSVHLQFSEHQKAQTEKGFLAHTFSTPNRAHYHESSQEKKEWEQIYNTGFPAMPQMPAQPKESVDFVSKPALMEKSNNEGGVIHWGHFLLTTLKSGILIVHKVRAREKIAYEKLKNKLTGSAPGSQNLLFPFEREESPADIILIKEALPFLQKIGFEMQIVGNNTISITGIPSGLKESDSDSILSDLFAQIISCPLTLKDPMKEKLLSTMASGMARTSGEEDSNFLVDELFACPNPEYTNNGKKIFHILSEEMFSNLLS